MRDEGLKHVLICIHEPGAVHEPELAIQPQDHKFCTLLRGQTSRLYSLAG